MIQLRVPAKSLMVGDRCRGSGALVTEPPVPDGPRKVALTVVHTRRDHSRRGRRVSWRADTLIGINRPDANDQGSD